VLLNETRGPFSQKLSLIIVTMIIIITKGVQNYNCCNNKISSSNNNNNKKTNSKHTCTLFFIFILAFICLSYIIYSNTNTKDVLIIIYNTKNTFKNKTREHFFYSIVLLVLFVLFDDCVFYFDFNFTNYFKKSNIFNLFLLYIYTKKSTVFISFSYLS